MSYTKGEWKIDEGSIPYIVCGKYTIGEVYDSTNYAPLNNMEIPSEKEGKSNAQLISAAPDCYEGLKDILNIIKELRVAGLAQGSEYIKRLDKAQQATNKAEGKDST